MALQSVEIWIKLLVVMEVGSNIKRCHEMSEGVCTSGHYTVSVQGVSSVSFHELAIILEVNNTMFSSKVNTVCAIVLQ